MVGPPTGFTELPLGTVPATAPTRTEETTGRIIYAPGTPAARVVGGVIEAAFAGLPAGILARKSVSHFGGAHFVDLFAGLVEEHPAVGAGGTLVDIRPGTTPYIVERFGVPSEPYRESVTIAVVVVCVCKGSCWLRGGRSFRGC